MRLLLFSDVHRDLSAAQRLVNLAAYADVVVGAGDFAVKREGLQETIDVLAAIARPTLLVPGNNESDAELSAACAGWRSARVCHGDGVEIDGCGFFGLGGGIPPTPWDWSFDLEESEAEAKLAACPAGGVLVLHSPPHGHLDGGGDGTGGTHLGSRAELDAIVRTEPRLVVCGHIHECWGEESRIGKTRVVNPGPQGCLVDL